MGYMLELVMVDVGNGGHDEALTVVGLMVEKWKGMGQVLWTRERTQRKALCRG